MKKNNRIVEVDSDVERGHSQINRKIQEFIEGGNTSKPSLTVSLFDLVKTKPLKKSSRTA